MEATEAKLDIKVTQLKMSIEKTNTILEAGKPEAIETPFNLTVPDYRNQSNVTRIGSDKTRGKRRDCPH